MSTWIQQLFLKDKADSTKRMESQGIETLVDEQANGPTEMVFEKDRFRVKVFSSDHHLGDTAPGEFWLMMEFLRQDGWQPILQMHEVHLWKIRSVLDDVREYLTLFDPAD